MVNNEGIVSSIATVRTAVGIVLAMGIYIVGYAFMHYGLAGGVAVALIPAILCVLWFTLQNPAVSMLGLFVVNYFIMATSRYLHDVPIGTFLDAVVAYNILMVTLQALVRKIEWRNARNGLTAAAGLWLLFCLLMAFNPDAVSHGGYLSALRSFAIYFFAIVILTQVTMAEYKYLKYMLAIWAVLTLLAVGKACIQKFIGFNEVENYWLFVLGGRRTHIIYSGIRYFSFFSDAANFSASMGFSMVVFSIAGLYYRNSWMKFFMFFVAAAACYGMLISGTRSALAVPFVGYTVFVILSGNVRMMFLGVIMIIGAFVFLNFTSIGQGNSIIRRARSAFNPEDASFQVRMRNQATIRELMEGHPLGVGLGNGGGKALEYAPKSPLSQVPTDSWFVMMWVETGVIGVLLHIATLLYILARGSYLVVFRLRDTQLRGFTAAMVAGIAGMVVMAYGNEILGQIPNGAIIYMCMGFIFLSPHFDRELAEARKGPPVLS